MVRPDRGTVAAARKLGRLGLDNLTRELALRDGSQGTGANLDQSDASDARLQRLVEEECLDPAVGLLRRPAFAQDVRERPRQLVEALGIDTEELQCVLLRVDSKDLEDLPSYLGPFRRRRAPERCSQEDHPAEVLGDGCRVGTLRPLLAVDESLGGDKPAETMGDEDDGTIVLASIDAVSAEMQRLGSRARATLTVLVLDRLAASFAQRSSASLWISVFATRD